MNRLHLGILSAFVIAALAAASPRAAADTVFDNTNGTNTPGGYVVGQYGAFCAPCSYTLGAAFTVPAGPGYTLGQIGVLVSSASATDNQTNIGLYTTGAGDVPGTLLESWTSGVTTTIELLNLPSISTIELEAGQQYWVVLGMSDPTATNYWWVNPYGQIGLVSNSYNGGPFTPASPSGYGVEAFYIDGSPTPEPSSWLLFVTGLAGLGAVAARRRARQP
jgi:hypothetical protein